mgnify:CR=1 FL=1
MVRSNAGRCSVFLLPAGILFVTILFMPVLEIKQNALHEIAVARDAKELEAARVKYLGRESGELTVVLRSLKNLSADEKKQIGPVANEARAEMEAAIESWLILS